MYEVLKNREIAKNIMEMEFYAPHIVRNYQPGQFIVIIPREESERIPLTIVETKGVAIRIIYQIVGKTTSILASFKEGERLYGVLGPLGNPAEIENFGNVVCIGGGVGTGVIYPEIKALKEAGNYVISIIGARSKDYLILTDEIKNLSDEFYITTDDGSAGEKGVVTLPLKRLLDTKKIDRVIAIGPVIMMKKTAELCREKGVKIIVSLNPIMVDATGMCGACRVEVGGRTYFACVDGPEFDGAQVNFDLLMKRLNQYKEEERISYERYKSEES